MDKQEKFRKLTALLGKGLDSGEWTATVQGSLATDDGYAYNATLLRAGRKVASVTNGGTGGPTDVRFQSPSDEEALKAYCATLPPDKSYDMELPYDVELFAATLVEIAMEAASLRRRAKKSTLAACGGEVSVFSAPYSPETVARIEARNPGKFTFLNELLSAGAM